MIRHLGLLSICALAAVMTRPGAVSAAVLVVDTIVDDPAAVACAFATGDDCSLRGAIIHANGTPEADTIMLQASTYTLTQPNVGQGTPITGDLDITGPLELVGRGKELTTVDANGLDRVFHVDGTGAVTFRDLTITGGVASHSGGGILLSAMDSFSLIGCSVRSNEASFDSTNTGGGGIAEQWAYGTILIEDSSITGNVAELGGGLLVVEATTTVHRSTVSGNTATFHGSGIFTGSDLSLINSTVSSNSEGPTPTGALLLNGASATVTSSTIVAGQTSFAVAALGGTTTLGGSVLVGECTTYLPTFGSGTLATDGGNLESPGNTCNLGFLELRNVPDPMLAPLLPPGRGYHLPLPGSPAIDQQIAAAGCPGEDQRGVARPQDGDGDLDAVCDIGAVEVVWADGSLIFADGFESGDASSWSSEVP